MTAKESESKQGRIGEVSGQGVVPWVRSFPLEPAIGALHPSPPFNVDATGACLAQKHTYPLESLALRASKWQKGQKKVSEINPGDGAEILASNVFLLAI